MLSPFYIKSCWPVGGGIFTVVLICISLLTNKSEALCAYGALHISPFVKCLFRSFVWFLIRLFFFILLDSRGSLYILDKKKFFSILYFAIFFSELCLTYSCCKQCFWWENFIFKGYYFVSCIRTIYFSANKAVLSCFHLRSFRVLAFTFSYN